MSFKDSLLGLLIVIIWGVNFLAIAWGLDGLPPLLMGALRFAFVFCVGFMFIKKPDIPLKWMVAYALAISFGQFAFLFSAMSMGMPAGLASLILQSQALFTLIFAALLLNEKIKFAQLLSMMVAGVGLYIIAGTGEDSSMTLIGFVLTIIGAASWALGNVVNRIISNKGFKPGIDLVIWSAWIPVIPFMLSSFIFEGPDLIMASLQSFSWVSFLALTYLAVAASISGYGLWSYLLGRYPAGTVAPLSLGVPIVGISVSAYFLNESITDMQWIGGSLVLLGLIINAFWAKLTLKLGFKKPVVKQV
ncbi:EamA family transporter [Pseudocolwellia sp. AS88]|uniref:EamA family transporter n=1 Tax=Pseudocolwellia sp. AS88 TaxID=3063958 RepID=UPI0026EE6BEA|nr:EamA family transporter [Pseudocolwellia sp. AS88]MDO7086665.1 EamA family transporter [Pseudocolwellia sp. AS88]